MYSDLQVSGLREGQGKNHDLGGERWPFQCKQLGACTVFVRLAAIGQLNDATYGWNSARVEQTAKVCTIADRRPTTGGAELSLQLRKIALRP